MTRTLTISPLGDQAVLAYCENENAAVSLAHAVRSANPPWLLDVVPAYASVGVFFDADRVAFAEVSRCLVALVNEQHTPASNPARLAVVPVCYEMGHDFARVCEHTGLSRDDVIRLHCATTYSVYAIGFVPGFPYLGYLPRELCGVGRLPSPRVRVESGSVGLTARQTGIYPLPRPGGWNLIGRTPLTVVDVASGFFPLRVGDRVKFTRIDEQHYRELEGERLSVIPFVEPPTG